MTTEWEVLLPKQIDPAGPASIADFATCTSMDEYDSYDDALADIGRYDAVIVRVAQLDADVIDRAEKLQVIAKHGTGLDNVDMDAASRRDIVVCNTPGANAQSVAEHAIALLFGVRRNLHTADRHVREGEWDRGAYTGQELSGATLGILGFGNIGRKTAQLARGIGMDIRAYDPKKRTHIFPDWVEPAASVEALFERSDAVSVHAPLTEATRHSVSTAELRALGERGVLINTSRGAIVEETALIETVQAGELGGAGLDTFETEPLGPDHPLADRDEILLTPHIGGSTTHALSRMSTQAATNVRTVYEGGVPESTRNRDRIGREVAQ